MKKIYSMKKTRIGFLFAFLLMAVHFISCSLFTDQKITDYLYDKSQKIQIAEARFSTPSQTDKEGVISISSENECVVTYLVNNPNGLALHATVTNAADGNSAIAALANPYTATVSDDNNYVFVTLTEEMLRRMDMGNDVSPVVSLAADSYTGEIPAFTEKIRANSKPPAVTGACVMLDTSYALNATSSHDSSKGKYVLCFNLPDELFDSGGIHGDVKKVYATGLSSVYSKGIALNINAAANTWNTTDLPSNPSALYGANTYLSPVTVTFVPGKHPVYLLTQVQAYYGDSQNFTITLEDEKGLQSNAVVAVNSTKLKAVTTNITNETQLASGKYQIALVDALGNKTDYYTVTMAAPVKTNKPLETVSGASVLYSLYTGSVTYTLLTTGSGNEGCSFNLPAGSYKITAHAQKDGYVDSDETSWEFIVGDDADKIVTATNVGDATVRFELSLSPLVFSRKIISSRHDMTFSATGYTVPANTTIASPALSNVLLVVMNSGKKYVSSEGSADAYTVSLPLDVHANRYQVTASFVYNSLTYSGSFYIYVLE